MHLGNLDNLIKTMSISLSSDGNLKAEGRLRKKKAKRYKKLRKLLIFIISAFVLHEKTDCD